MSLSAYRALPRRERMEWFFFVYLRSKKEEWAQRQAKEDAERESARHRTDPPAKFR